MVEGKITGGTFYKCIWSGGKTASGKFICYLENHWKDFEFNISLFDELRKIDPDKELKELADEFMNKPALLTANGNPCYLLSDVKSMLIEAMKKVQSKK